MSFVHLHCHSHYSLLEGAASPEELVERALQLKMQALALTDHNGLYGVVPFYKAALERGIQPIVGAELDVDNGDRLVLLAESAEGYRNLCRLITAAHLGTSGQRAVGSGQETRGRRVEDRGQQTGDERAEGRRQRAADGRHGAGSRELRSTDNRQPATGNPARTPALCSLPSALSSPALCPLPSALFATLRDHTAGLTALSGGRQGLVWRLARAGKLNQASRVIGEYMALFGADRYFVELVAHEEGDHDTVRRLVRLARSLGVPFVAANDVLYLEPRQERTARILSAIRTGTTLDAAHPAREPTAERYLKSIPQMEQLFEDYPEALSNSVYLARRCVGSGVWAVGSHGFHHGDTEARRTRGDREQGAGGRGQQTGTSGQWTGVSGQQTGDGRPDGEQEAGAGSPASDEDHASRITHLEAPSTQHVCYENSAPGNRQPTTQHSAHSTQHSIIPLGTMRFPRIELRAGETAFSQLWKDCFAGLQERYRPLTPPVIDRLKMELEMIERLGFSPYFLIVADIARWAREQGIAILGRGSAGDSLVAYVLGIAQVDPIAHDLYFERFLNPYRADPPDIDLDICWRRRDEVLQYVYETYGHESVAMIATHVSFKLNSAWRDVGKVLGLTPADIDRIGDALPHGHAVADLDDENSPPEWHAFASLSWEERGLEDRDALDGTLADCAAIAGKPRHLGIHCGGLVIAPGPLTDEMPMQRATKGLVITQFEMDAVADVGLVKMDLLGSRALSALADAVAAIRRTGVDLSVETIPWDDPATYALMAAGATLGCFQLESPGMRTLLKVMRPRSFADMIAAVSLFRPGPLEGGFKNAYIRRRVGEEPITYMHPYMEQVLAETYGVIVYQEQFLRLVHELAGFDLGAAEQMRKQISKNPDPIEREAMKERFVAGAIRNDVPQALADEIWAVLEGYSGFGFCKAHAASYGVVAYRSAYCKAHYPAEFIAAMLSNQGGFYAPAAYVEDAKRLGCKILGPDVNRSDHDFAGRRKTLLVGLGAVRGLAKKSIGSLLAERRNGPFVSLYDLMSRVALSERELTSLIKAGALDRLAPGLTRRQLLWQMKVAHRGQRAEGRGQQTREQRAEGRGQQTGTSGVRAVGSGQQTGTSGVRAGGRGQGAGDGRPDGEQDSGAGSRALDEDHASGITHPEALGTQHSVLSTQHVLLPSALCPLPSTSPPVPEYTPREKAMLEEHLLGFALDARPLEFYAEELRKYGPLPSPALQEHVRESVVIAGRPIAGRRHITKQGQWLLFLTLEDDEGIMELVLFPRVYRQYAGELSRGGPFLVRGTVESPQPGELTLVVEKVKSLNGLSQDAPGQRGSAT